MNETTQVPQSSSRKKNLATLFLVVLIDLIGFGMILPLIPFLGKSTSSSAVMVGLLMSIYSIMQFLFSPFWGGISDRYGRKPVLLISILGACISHTAFALVSTYWAFFLTRMFAGFFSANISTAMAAASDLSTKEKRTQTMGLIGAAFGLGFVLGPFLGAQGAALGKGFGFGDQFASILAGALCLINFIFCLFFFKESLRKKTKEFKLQLYKLNPFSSLAEASAGLRLSVFLFFSATLSLALIEIVLFFAVQEQFNWGYQEASLGFAAIGLVMAITQGGLIRPLKKRFSETQLILGGGSLFCLGLLGAFQFVSLSAFGSAVLILSLGYAILNPSLSGFISLQSSQEKQGATFGLTHGFSALSRIIGPVLGTFLLDHYTTKAPFLIAALVIGLSLVLFLSLFKKLKI